MRVNIERKEIGQYEFPSGVRKRAIEVEYSGITIRCAKRINHKKQALAIDDILRLISLIPKKIRTVLKAIELDEGRNPDDAYWAETYNLKGFRAFAMSGRGSITFFQNQGFKNAKSTEDAKQYAIPAGLHEVGHNLAISAFSSSMPPTEWIQEANRTNSYVSSYASVSPAEDFAETFVMYILQPGKLDSESYNIRREIMERIVR